LNVTHIAHFATIGIPIISKMHREMSGERKPDGRRQLDCNGCQNGHCVVIAELVSQYVPTLL
jgi:hypothetical protein